MNYKDTLNYLFSQLPMYQRTGAAAYKKDIGNIVKACDILERCRCASNLSLILGSHS